MKQAVIISAARSALGKFQGALKGFTAPEIGSFAVRAAVERARLDANQVDEVIMGCVLQAGLGQNPARQAALKAGLPDTVSALTVNKVCGSGLKAVMLAAQSVALGDADVVVAGGMESMTNAPYLLTKAREGYRLGNGEVVDSMVHDGLWCAFDNWHMGETGEVVAERYQITREQQDEYALASQRKAVAAVKAGRFKDEIVPITLPQRKGAATAGNAATINDGAAAVVVTSEERAKALGVEPLARVAAQATSGVEPKMVMMAPLEAVRKVAAKAGWELGGVDLFELNEAFSSQSVALVRELGIDPQRVNVNGGAVALGHPIGASGARVLVTLLYEMRRRGARRGIASLCLGGGNAVALAVER
jgi:acetyl-CoA C-acetyltransferase